MKVEIEIQDINHEGYLTIENSFNGESSILISLSKTDENDGVEISIDDLKLALRKITAK